MSHIERMMNESEELKTKLDALKVFIQEDGGIFCALPKDEQFRMIKQLAFMEGYLEVLEQRLLATQI